MKRILLSILFLCVLFGIAHGQSGAKYDVQLPDILYTSPQAAAMYKFGDYSTNLYNGLVDITIPIHQIDINGIHIPIEFKYHTSGVRYTDVPIELGLGWTLMTGGCMTFCRTGREGWNPIEITKTMSEIDPHGMMDQETDNVYLEGIYKGSIEYPTSTYHKAYPVKSIDGEVDIVNVSFLGNNVKYVRSPGSPRFPKGKEFFIPAKPWKWSEGTAYGQPSAIIDEKGIQYWFEQLELNGDFRSNKTYYLSKIVSADNRDTIRFTYNSMSTLSQFRYLDMGMYKSQIAEAAPFSPSYRTESGSTQTIFFNPPRLESIMYRGGKIRFEYNTLNYNRQLNKIFIYDRQQQIVKSISVAQSYFEQSPKYWSLQRLDAVTFCDNISNEVYDYKFEYNNISSLGFDYFGFINGSNWDGGYCGPNIDNSTVTKNMNRDPGRFQSQSGMLKKITYPTKGFTEFVYEQNKGSFNEVIPEQELSGLRIKEIRNYDNDGTLKGSKWYEYGRGISSFYEINNYDYSTYNKTITIEKDIISTAIVVTGLSEINTFHNMPNRFYFLTGSPVVYPEVSEYIGMPNQPSGKTVYHFCHQVQESNYTSISIPAPKPLRSYEWKNGLLKGHEVYAYHNGVYSKVYSQYLYYKDLNTEEILNMNSRKMITLYFVNLADSEIIGLQHDNDLHFSDVRSGAIAKNFYGPSRFEYYQYYIGTGLSVPEYKKEIKDGVEKITCYEYDKYGQPIEARTVSHTQDTVKMTTKYSSDASFSSMPVYSAMIKRNNISAVVEQSEFKNNNLIVRRITDYAEFNAITAGSQMYKPYTIRLSTLDDNAIMEERLKFYKYDVYGNPTYIIKDNNAEIVYIWGYSGMYPVAEIRNADYQLVSSVLNDNSLSFCINPIYEICIATVPSNQMLSLLNSLRTDSRLSKAFVSTFEYKPSVGLTKATDASGRTTKYEYDSFGRLEKIVDEKGNTIKAYEYNYAK